MSAKISFNSSLLTASIVKGGHISEKRLITGLKVFRCQGRASVEWSGGSSQVRQMLALFCGLVALVLSWGCVECLWVARAGGGIGFGGGGRGAVSRGSYGQDIKSLVVSQLVRQLVHTMFITNNLASFHLWLKENLVKYQYGCS